jgi:hypothetical protein
MENFPLKVLKVKVDDRSARANDHAEQGVVFVGFIVAIPPLVSELGFERGDLILFLGPRLGASRRLSKAAARCQKNIRAMKVLS